MSFILGHIFRKCHFRLRILCVLINHTSSFLHMWNFWDCQVDQLAKNKIFRIPTIFTAWFQLCSSYSSILCTGDQLIDHYNNVILKKSHFQKYQQVKHSLWEKYISLMLSCVFIQVFMCVLLQNSQLWKVEVRKNVFKWLSGIEFQTWFYYCPVFLWCVPYSVAKHAAKISMFTLETTASLSQTRILYTTPLFNPTGCAFEF